MKYWGSLSPDFSSASRIVKEAVKQTFSFILCGGFLNRLSLPLDSVDIFSTEYRPSQTAHLLMFPKVRYTVPKGQCYMFASDSAETKSSTAPAYALQSKPYINNRMR